jgi:hypothetical protein
MMGVTTTRGKKAAIHDPVVVRGQKYRITGFEDKRAHLHQRIGGRHATVLAEDLALDKVAGVWRPTRRSSR